MPAGATALTVEQYMERASSLGISWSHDQLWDAPSDFIVHDKDSLLSVCNQCDFGFLLQ